MTYPRIVPDEPKQQTPQGHEIPIPRRDSVFAALRKVAGKATPSDAGERGADEEQSE